MKFLNRYLFIGIGIGILVIVLGFFGLVGAALFYYRHASGGDSSAQMSKYLKPPELPGAEPMANFKPVFTGLDGKALPLVDLKGKVIFLNFWATWCSPCRAEMPSIQELYKQMNGEVAFVLVSQEEKSKVMDFVAKNKYTLPIYIYARDLPAEYESRSIPTTFIISPEGKIVFKHGGSAKWDDPTAIEYLKGLAKTNTGSGGSSLSATDISRQTSDNLFNAHPDASFNKK